MVRRGLKMKDRVGVRMFVFLGVLLMVKVVGRSGRDEFAKDGLM